MTIPQVPKGKKVLLGPMREGDCSAPRTILPFFQRRMWGFHLMVFRNSDLSSHAERAFGHRIALLAVASLVVGVLFGVFGLVHLIIYYD